MQTRIQDQTTRLQDGSIDYRYYAQRGQRLRNGLLRRVLARWLRLPSLPGACRTVARGLRKTIDMRGTRAEPRREPRILRA